MYATTNACLIYHSFIVPSTKRWYNARAPVSLKTFCAKPNQTFSIYFVPLISGWFLCQIRFTDTERSYGNDMKYSHWHEWQVVPFIVSLTSWKKKKTTCSFINFPANAYDANHSIGAIYHTRSLTFLARFFLLRARQFSHNEENTGGTSIRDIERWFDEIRLLNGMKNCNTFEAKAKQ